MRCEKHLEDELIIPEPIENKPKSFCVLKPLRQEARGNIKIDNKQLNKQLANKMINPYYFTDTALQVGFFITLGSHHITQCNSKITIKQII